MEPNKGRKQSGETKAVQPVSELLPETSYAQTPPPGKHRKTHFELCGGRGIIWSLPCLFGRKRVSKGSFRKGAIEIKTQEDDFRMACDLETRRLRDSAFSNAQGAQPVTYHRKRLKFLRRGLVPDHKYFWEKPFKFPPSKGRFVELFSSMRRCKKVDPDKTDICELPLDVTKDTGPASEILGSFEEGLLITTTNYAKMNPQKLNKDNVRTCMGRNPQIISDIVHIDGETLCIKSELICHAEMHQVFTEKVQPLVKSPDQVSLFLDVASLKSFDSSTGCGDMISDKDSVEYRSVEIAVLGDQWQSVRKRSSCYITYQGGGEGTASSSEALENVSSLWDRNASADVCFTSNQQACFSANPDSLVTSIKTVAICLSDDAANNSDVFLTTSETDVKSWDGFPPQNDEQMSVLRTDGGQDSITSGPDDDDIGDSISRIRKKRLPKDSCRGEGLYEFSEPDDGPLEGKSTFEIQPAILDALEALDLILHSIDTKFPPGFTDETLTDEQNSSHTQHEHICCELQGLEKRLIEEKFASEVEKSIFEKEVEFISKLNKKQASILELSSPKDKTVYQKYSCLKENWKSLAFFGDGNLKVKDGPLVDVKTTDAVCYLPKTSHPFSDWAEYEMQGNKRGSILPVNERKLWSSSKGEPKADYEQTDTFPNVLVDFKTLFNDWSRDLGGADSNYFPRNMLALPTMVTFDISDTENEGEWERQVEMVTEQDLDSCISF